MVMFLEDIVDLIWLSCDLSCGDKKRCLSIPDRSTDQRKDFTQVHLGESLATLGSLTPTGPTHPSGLLIWLGGDWTLRKGAGRRRSCAPTRLPCPPWGMVTRWLSRTSPTLCCSQLAMAAMSGPAAMFQLTRWLCLCAPSFCNVPESQGLNV